MKIADKINMERAELVEKGPITIVAFGDSVTHGAVGPGEIDYESVYWNRLKKKINAVRSYVPVNVINAGIGGLTAKGSLERMDAQVLVHRPDLVIVCFGLNDINGELQDYLDSLREIFIRCKNTEAEVIFMTPNMLNTYVPKDLPEPHMYEYACKTADIQNSGKMDMFIYSACEVAKEIGITVCDCYTMWKKKSETEDTTILLANRINHPIREMHELFAESLFNIIFDKETCTEGLSDDTMYRK